MYERRTILKTVAAIGTLSVIGSTPVLGHDEDEEDFLIDLGTGTTDFEPDDFGTQDDDWQVSNSPDGTTGPAYSIEPDPSWVTHPEVNWIDYDGSGGHPFDGAGDPEGDYTFEIDFHIDQGFCKLRIHDWAVDDKAQDNGRGFYLEKPDGSEELITSGAGHGSLKGPVGPIPLAPGDHTLRVETYNAFSVSGLLVHADVLCAPEIDIKPCSDPNAINPESKGVIPVGIRGNDHFDPASEINVDSLRFGAPEVVDGGDGAEAAHGGHREDTIPCEGDGNDDLVVHFPTEDTGFEEDDDRGKLVGQTTDGFEFAASDSVKIVGGGNGNGGGPGGP